MSTIFSDRSHVPDILRSPELHDFSDIFQPPGRLNRSLMIAFALAALTLLGHFAVGGMGTPSEIVEHASPMTRA